MGLAPSHISDQPIKPLSPNHFCLCPQFRSLYAIGIQNTHPVHQQISEAIKTIGEVKYPRNFGEIVTYEEEPNVVKFPFFSGRIRHFKDSLRTKLIWSAIFFNLLKLGWRVRLATDVRRHGDSSVFIFEHVADQTGYHGVPEAIACLSVSSNSKLQLISKECYHQDLSDDLSRILTATWSRYGHQFSTKVKEHTLENFEDTVVTQFEFHEVVWYDMTGGREKVRMEGRKLRLEARMTMAHILGQLGKSQGWELLTKGQVKGKTDYVWFVKYPVASSVGQFTLPFSETLPPPSYFQALRENESSSHPKIMISDLHHPDAESPALIHLDTHDKIRIAGFSDEINQQFGQCLESGGLIIERKNDEDYKYLHNGYEFKIVGSPWLCRDEEAVKSRYALGLCLEMLRLNNFSVLTCLDISNNLSDKSAFLLVRSAVPVQAALDFGYNPMNIHTPIFSDLPATDQRSLSTLIVSLSETNQLRFIGNFDDRELEDFMEPLRYYPFGIRGEFWENDIMALRQNYDRCYKVEFKMRPWAILHYPDEYRNLGWHVMSMVCNLFYKMESQGWKVNCSGDVSSIYYRNSSSSSSSSYSIDTHSWFLSKIK